MSLKQYLFSLVGGLILLLTSVQVILIIWLQSNIEQDVKNKVKIINEHAFELALDNVLIEKKVVSAPQENTSKTPVEKITILSDHVEVVNQQSQENTSEKHVQVYRYKNDDHTSPLIEIITDESLPPKRVKAEHLKQAFGNQIDVILKDGADNRTPLTKLQLKGGTINGNQRVSEENSNTKIDQLLFRIQLILIVGGVIALGIAYWLSIRFNRPLNALMRGFEHLSQGNYHYKVEEVGVNEIKTTIKRFNLLGNQLVALSEAEKHHKEISHLAELGEVTRGLAHALRSPIHTIGLSLEQLLEQPIDSSQRQSIIARIQHKISHIDASIKSLLTLTTSGIDRNEQCPVKAIIQDIVLEYKTSQTKKISFEIVVGDNTLIQGAESEIRNIFHTLINNACDASQEGQSVIIKVRDNGQTVDFSVSDHGKGIDKHIENQLFNPHVSTKADGAGMGLYIAKRILTLHYQGNIALTNKVLDDKITGCCAQGSFTKQANKINE